MKKIITLNSFIVRSNIIHGNDTWDYSLIKSYNNNNKEKIKIIHKACGQITERTFHSHLRTPARGCRFCSNRKIKIKKWFINSIQDLITEFKKIHGFEYDYSLINTYKMTKKVSIKHIACNQVFLQKNRHHLNGHGCSLCFRAFKKTNSSFIKEAKKIHGDKYDYNFIEYKNIYTNVNIKCLKCNEVFAQRPDQHLNGSGCPKCSGGSISKVSQKWLNYKEKTENIIVLREHKIKLNNKTIVADGYDPTTNTVYEFHGDFWHGNPKLYDPDKKHPINNKKTFGELFIQTTKRSSLIRGAGYNLVSIWESEWNEIEKNVLFKQTA